MTDLDSALVYLIRREVPNKKTIKGEALEALINFTELLTKVGISRCVRYLRLLLELIIIITFSNLRKNMFIVCVPSP